MGACSLAVFYFLKLRKKKLPGYRRRIHRHAPARNIVADVYSGMLAILHKTLYFSTI